MATPSAAPIWKAVLLRPEASPDSRSSTPARAATVAVTKTGPIAGPVDEQTEEHVADVAAADRDLGEDERPSRQQHHARRGDRPEANLEHDRLADDRPDGRHDRKDGGAEPELDGRVAEHLLGVEREDERRAERDGAEEEHHEVGPDERARAEDPQRHERRAVARLDQREGSKEHGRAREEEDRPHVAPADRPAPRRPRTRAGRARP